jgi:hypothetical protein
MARFSIDLKVAMTAYVVADDEEAAIAKVIEHFGTERSPEGCDLLPDYMDMTGDQDGSVKLSPAVTFYGRFDDAQSELLGADEDVGRCTECGTDLANPSACGAEDGVCGECIGDENCDHDFALDDVMINVCSKCGAEGPPA